MLSATQMADYLREVTSIVDATKGTLQLEILIHLYERGPQGVDEISKALGRRRKAVTDALRKLRLKEVVMEVPGSGESGTAAITYVLTDQGKDHVGHLKGMFESKGAPPPPTARREGFRLVEMIEEVPLLFYTTDAIIALGLAGNKGLPVRELARLFGLSERRAVTYLDLFMDAPGATLARARRRGIC